MYFTAFTIWVGMRLDRPRAYFPCNPLQSVNRSEAEIGRLTHFNLAAKSVIKNASPTVSMFLFSTRTILLLMIPAVMLNSGLAAAEPAAAPLGV